jgi:hypothetical protein
VPDAPAEDPGSNNMRFLFVICGGLIGLAIWHMLCSLGRSAQPSGRRRAAPAAIAHAQPSGSGSTSVRGVLGFLFLLAGVGLLALGAIQAWDTWELAEREARAVTAAELAQAQGPASAPAGWLSYTFARSKPAGVSVLRNRVGGSGSVEAPCLLVQVGDQWLVAEVAPGFSGNRLVGRLQALNSPAARDLVRRIHANQETPVALLPYEFVAIDGSESEHQVRYEQAASFGLIGLPLLVLGLWLVCRRRPAAAIEAAPTHDPFAAPALPRG